MPNLIGCRTVLPDTFNVCAVKIYTRKGDDGTTSLWYGGRVAEERSPHRGLRVAGRGRPRRSGWRAHWRATSGCAADILRLQDELFVAGAELATAPRGARPARGRREPRSTTTWSTWLEQAIDGYMAEVDLPPKFVIPGGTQLSAQLDVARSVLRRAERRIVALGRTPSDLERLGGPRYVNRASDLAVRDGALCGRAEPELFEGRGRSSARTDREGQRPAPQGLRAQPHVRPPHADRRRAGREGRHRHRPAPDRSCSR